MIGPARVARTALILSLLVVGGLLLHAPRSLASGAELQRALDARDWSRASEILEGQVARDPGDADAWNELAMVRYRQGRYGDAAAAGKKAADESPGLRPGALYDVACFLSLAGEVDAARESLHRAYDAGFVNFDILVSDTDLDPLRPDLGVALPASSEYRAFRAPSGVEIGYRLVLPVGYDAARSYPGLVTFAPGGGGPRSSDWAMAHLWGKASDAGDWIVLHLVAPEGGWYSHPAHHAMEALFDEVLAGHRIDGGRFHLASLGDGCRVASTYASMSRRYFDAVTLVNSTAWLRWDDEEIADLPGHRYTLVVGESHDAAVRDVERSLPALRQAGRDVDVVVLPGEGVNPKSMLDGGLIRLIVQRNHPDRAEAVR